MKRQFAKNLTSNWAVYFSAAIVSFFLTPYIIKSIGQGAYGVWILVGAFSGYLGLFDFGIGYGVIRYVARYQHTGEVERRNQVVATAFYVAAILALAVIGATIFLVHNAADFFDIPIDLVTQSKWVISLIGLSIAVNFPLSIFSGALSGGLWRFDLFNKTTLVMVLVQTAMTVTFLEFGWGLPGLGLSALIGSIVSNFWKTRILYKLLPDLSIRLRLFSRQMLRQIGSHSFFSFLLVLASRLAFYSDSFVVGIFRTVEDIAIFGIAVKLTEYLRQLTFTLTKLFMPMAAKYDPDTDKASLRRILYDGSRLNLLFSLPLSLVLFFWGGILIRLWVGDAFAYSETVLRVILIGHLLAFMQGIGGEILLGVGRHRVFSLLSMLAATTNIVLSVILVKKIGLIGVAWGTTVPLAVISVFYLPFASLRVVGGSIGDFLARAVLPAILAVLIPAGIIIYGAAVIETVEDLIIWGLAAGIVYCIASYYLGFRPDERVKIGAEVRKMMGRFLS